MHLDDHSLSQTCLGTRDDSHPSLHVCIWSDNRCWSCRLRELLRCYLCDRGNHHNDRSYQSSPHPERYGPQQARPGRPKQSRAKGLARAVIESIPIVRFGENNANAAAPRDIELAVTGLANGSKSATVNANISSINPDAIAVTSGTSTNMPETANGDLSTTEPTIQTRPGGLECSICLNDFVQGEEIRVLPCSHRFHRLYRSLAAECIRNLPYMVSCTFPLLKLPY